MSRTLLIRNGDMVTSTSGEVQVVTGTLKAKQDLVEYLTIEVQVDGFGAGIVSLPGYAGDADGLSTEFELRRRLSDGFSRFIELQRQSLINRTPDEIFTKLINLQVTRQRSDPRVFSWRIDVLTAAGQEVSRKGTLSLGQ